MAADVDLTSTTVVYTSATTIPTGTVIPAENLVVVLNNDATVFQNISLVAGSGGGGSTRPASGFLYPRGQG